MVEGRIKDPDYDGGTEKKQAYIFDRCGNLLSAATTVGTGSPVTRTMPVVSSTNRLSAAGYDAGGNVTSWAGYAYGYDPFDMLRYAPNRIYVYGPGDERIWTIEHSGATWTGETSGEPTSKAVDALTGSFCLGGDLMPLLYTTEDPNCLRQVNDLIHDYWFDLDGILELPSAQGAILHLPFERPPVEWRPRRGALFRGSEAAPPLVEADLFIENVQTWHKTGDSGLGRYDFDSVTFDRTRGRLRVTANLPLEIELEVHGLRVTVAIPGIRADGLPLLEQLWTSTL